MKSKTPFNMAMKMSQINAIWNKPDIAKEYCYLRQTCAENLVERLTDITKKLPMAVDLGTNNSEFVKALGDNDLIENLSEFCWAPSQLPYLHSKPQQPAKVIDNWSRICPELIKEESCDLIVSNLALHWVNDLPETMTQIRKGLKPDGVFLGSMFGGNTLDELRGSLAIAEQEREGGVSAHISPMLPIADACGLLNGAGLQLVTIDTAKIVVEYDNAFSLMRHLWWMGESNASTSRRNYVSRETLMAASVIYQELFGTITKEGETLIPATFEVIFMIGWAPHEDQKKPLLPGQGKVSLTKLGKGASG